METAQGTPDKRLADWLLTKPSASAQRQYPPVVREFLAGALMKQPSPGWADDTLTAEYLTRLDSAGSKRAQILARDLQAYVNTMLLRLRAGTLKYPTVAWHYAVAKEFAEWLAGEGVTTYDSRQIRKSFIAYRQPAKVREGLAPAQLRDVLHWLPPDSKAFAMMAKSSGGRPEEIAGLTVYDVDTSLEPWSVTYGRHKATGAKEGGERTSYLDRETKPWVAGLLGAGDHSADPRLFAPMGRDAATVLRVVRRDWKRALLRAGLPYSVVAPNAPLGANGKPKLKVLRPLYLLRSYFKTKGGSKWGFGREVAELLMGHHGDATEGAYENYGLGELRELYAQGEQALWCEALFDEGERARGRSPGPAPTRP